MKAKEYHFDAEFTVSRQYEYESPWWMEHKKQLNKQKDELKFKKEMQILWLKLLCLGHTERSSHKTHAQPNEQKENTKYSDSFITLPFFVFFLFVSQPSSFFLAHNNSMVTAVMVVISFLLIFFLSLVWCALDSNAVVKYQWNFHLM